MMRSKIELGKQLGLEIRIQKEQKNYWYSYAIQKKEDIYFVYESEITEENMAKEVFNRNASHKNIGEIETKNNTIGSVIGFWK